MEIYIEKENKNISKEVKFESILRDLSISKESVLLVKNGKVFLENELVSNSDKLKVLYFVSGHKVLFTNK